MTFICNESCFRLIFLSNSEKSLKKNVQCFHKLQTAITVLFTDIDAVFQLMQDVDHLEGEIDHLERALIRNVFDIEERLSYRSLLHRTIRDICNVSDKVENVADRLTVLAAKRQI